MRAIRHVRTRFGNIAYTEHGSGPCALFVHGVFLNGHLWRNVIDRVARTRRCIAIDLMAHGETEISTTQDVSFSAQAEMIATFCEALGLDEVDLVANDSGGGIAQIFAARFPERLRTLTLTNCDVHDNYPPKAFEATRAAVAQGKLGAMLQQMLSAVTVARSRFGIAYEKPERLSEDTIRKYLAPLVATPRRLRNLERWFISAEDCSATVAIEPELRQLMTPTLIVWGTADPFFCVEWAHWLHRTIPGARKVIELEGAKLFFPEERPDELASALLEHWRATADVRVEERRWA